MIINFQIKALLSDLFACVTKVSALVPPAAPRLTDSELFNAWHSPGSDWLLRLSITAGSPMKERPGFNRCPTSSCQVTEQVQRCVETPEMPRMR